MAELTPKQEKFAQAFVETGNASDAYRRAYPGARRWKVESVNVAASRLLGNAKVSLRVRELQEAARKRHEITVDSLTAEALRALRMAEEGGRAGEMLKAVEVLARLHGLYTEKREVSAPGGRPVVVEIVHGDG